MPLGLPNGAIIMKLRLKGVKRKEPRQVLLEVNVLMSHLVILLKGLSLGWGLSVYSITSLQFVDTAH